MIREKNGFDETRKEDGFEKEAEVHEYRESFSNKTQYLDHGNITVMYRRRKFNFYMIFQP